MPKKNNDGIEKNKNEENGEKLRHQSIDCTRIRGANRPPKKAPDIYAAPVRTVTVISVVSVDSIIFHWCYVTLTNADNFSFLRFKGFGSQVLLG